LVSISPALIGIFLLAFQVSVGVSPTGYNSGVRGALSKMYTEEGFLALWKGNGTNVARIAPYSAIQFASFDYLQQFTMTTLEDHNSTARLLFTGALSGMISTFLCYPLDLVRSILTVQHDAATTQYKGMTDALSSIFRERGLFGLYKGLNATVLFFF
jgi:solute carrier family 25 phosphate transporter 23/24/25/41